MTKVLQPSAPNTDLLLRMIAKELDGQATPTARSPEKQKQSLDNELDSMKTPPDSPTRPKEKQARRKKTKVAPETNQAATTSSQQGEVPQSTAAKEPSPPPSPQVKLDHALFINEEGKVQVRVFDTLEIRAAFLRCCNSRCRPDEMHRVGMQPPCMTPQQFTGLCKSLDLLEPSGPLSLMDLGVTFTTRQEQQRDNGLSYIGFMDALMDLSLDTGRNIAAKLQEDNRGWQAHFDEMKNTMLRGNSMRRSEPAPISGSGSGTLRRPSIIQGDAAPQQPDGEFLRRSDSMLSNTGRPLCSSRGSARMSEPGARGNGSIVAQVTGRLSEGGVPPALAGVGGRFTRQATFRQGSHSSILTPAGDATRCTASRSSMRRTLTSSMSIRNSSGLSVNPDLPVNPLHAAVLNMYSPTAPDTPSPPHTRLGSARPKPAGSDGDKKEALPQLGTGEGRPSSGRPMGMPPKPKAG